MKKKLLIVITDVLSVCIAYGLALLLHQIPDRYSVLGYVIIIGMAVWMFFYNQRRDASDVK